MKTIRGWDIGVAGGLGILAALGAAGCNKPPSDTRLDLNLGGPPGLVVTGTYALQGVTSVFAATTPTNLSFSARDLAYTVQTPSNTAGLRVTLYVNNLPRTSTLAGTNGGVFGHYRLEANSESAGASSF